MQACEVGTGRLCCYSYLLLANRLRIGAAITCDVSYSKDAPEAVTAARVMPDRAALLAE